jgi:hypothetical protein
MGTANLITKVHYLLCYNKTKQYNTNAGYMDFRETSCESDHLLVWAKYFYHGYTQEKNRSTKNDQNVHLLKGHKKFNMQLLPDDSIKNLF